MTLAKLELATRRRVPWNTLTPPDPAGAAIVKVELTPNGRGYADTYQRIFFDLYLARGLK